MCVPFRIAYTAMIITSAISQKEPHYCNHRNTIVQLFEWKFEDIALECENFLQYHDYGAVQVSPVSENIILDGRPWYERYQPISYKIASRSGDEKEFKEMTRRCNAVGIRIFVDVVLNHMTTNISNAIGSGGSTATPIKLDFPAVPYNKNDFHRNCATDDNGPIATRNCQLLVGLLDLNQTRGYVRSKMIDFLNNLISLGAAGFRVGAAKYMWPNDLEIIYSSIKNLSIEFEFPPNSRPFVYQEVTDSGGEPISKNDYTHLGIVTEFNASISLGRIFKGLNGSKLAELQNYGPQWGFIKDGADALVFIDNHVSQRGHGGSNIITYKQRKLYIMANAFMLAHPYGNTRIMSSYRFTDSDQGPPKYSNGTIISPRIKHNMCVNEWVCEHRWNQIYNMVGFRKFVNGTPLNNWWSNNDQQIAFGRGNKGFVAFTNHGDIERKIKTEMPQGVYCDIISGTIRDGACTGKSVTVDQEGMATIELLADEKDGVIAIQTNKKRSSILVNEVFV